MGSNSSDNVTAAVAVGVALVQPTYYQPMHNRSFASSSSNDSGVVETAIFSAFGRYIFGTFREKAKIIM